MFENGPSDRMQLVGVGDLLPPGSCIVCGNGTCQQGYIRFGVSLEFEGELYLCWTCVVQASEILGCLIPDEANTLRTIAENVAEQNSTLRNELEIANERLKAFDTLIGPHITDATRSGGIVSSDPGPVAINDPSVTRGPSDELTGVQSESAESTKDNERKRSVRLTASDASSTGIL